MIGFHSMVSGGRLLGGCLIAAVLLVSVSGQGGAQPNDGGPAKQAQPQQPQPQQPSGPPPISEKPQAVPVAEQQKADPPAYDPRCDKPKDREDSDLCEQRRMSKAAEDSAWWAAFQSKLGIAGFVAVLLSLIFTGWAAWAAAIAAKAAQDSIEVASDTAKRQLRAYVSVSGVARVKDPGDLEGAGFAVLVDIKNDGQTPAYDFFQWAKISIREFPLKGPLELHCIETPSLGILAPQSKTMAFPTFKRDLSPLEEQAILSNGKAIYVYGEVTYRDAFERRHLTQFRFRCNGQGYPLGLFKPDGEGNEAT